VPYSEKQEQFFRARGHGFVPDDPKLRKLSPGEARKLSDEAAKTHGQKRAIKRMRGKH